MIPVMRPKLAPAEMIFPYLGKIDQNRFYSNGGPLVKALESRLAGLLNVDPDCIVTVGSATTGLALSLMAVTDKPDGSCLMPSWTFEASPVAARLAGYRPHFLNIDPATWALDSQQVIANGSDHEAILYVTPFGRPVETQIWSDVSARLDKPVIIDAAAGIDGLQVGHMPSVVSLHATKVLSSGEGGFVACLDTSLISRIRALANFGFSGSRQIDKAGLNGKMSEYTAAVGLAELDYWPTKKTFFRSVKERYDAALKQHPAIELIPDKGRDWITSTYNIRLLQQGANTVAAKLAAGDIDTRQWWGQGCHQQPAFRQFQHTDLAISENFAQSVLGLPFYPDLDEKSQRTVIDTLLRIL